MNGRACGCAAAVVCLVMAASCSSTRHPTATGARSEASRLATVASPGHAPSCRTRDLRVRLGPADSSLATHGQGGTILWIDNTSAQGCVLDGYPSIRLLDAKGQIIHTELTLSRTFWGGTVAERAVLLAAHRNQQASILAAWTQDGPNGACPTPIPVPVDVQVQLPGVPNTISVSVPYEPAQQPGYFRGCEGNFTLLPVQQGADPF